MPAITRGSIGIVVLRTLEGSAVFLTDPHSKLILKQPLRADVLLQENPSEDRHCAQ
jgi:hypothetical protein